jgi:hypothetical protein
LEELGVLEHSAQIDDSRNVEIGPQQGPKKRTDTIKDNGNGNLDTSVKQDNQGQVRKNSVASRLSGISAS